MRTEFQVTARSKSRHRATDIIHSDPSQRAHRPCRPVFSRRPWGSQDETVFAGRRGHVTVRATSADPANPFPNRCQINDYPIEAMLSSISRRCHLRQSPVKAVYTHNYL